MGYNIKQTTKDAGTYGKFTYSMTNRWGATSRDCSSYILSILRGNIDNLPNDWYTVTEEMWFNSNGWKKYNGWKEIQKEGDIYICYQTKNQAGDNAHTMYAVNDTDVYECNGYLSPPVQKRHFDIATNEMKKQGWVCDLWRKV